MAKLITVVLKRNIAAGVVSCNPRQIVVWGQAAEGDTIGLLAASLNDESQLHPNEAARKSNSDIVRAVCDKLFPGSWDFVAQGGTLEF